MVLKEIKSLQHPLVKHAVRLRQDRRTREESGQVLLVGEKLFREVKSTICFVTCAEEGAILVSEEVMKKITGVQEPDGFAAIAPLPSLPISKTDHVLILDGLADPGNVGALFRTALALGWDAIYLTKGSADPFNEKALRAAMGATFRLPFAWKEVEELSALPHLYVADLHGEKAEAKGGPIALVLGRESSGPSSWTKKGRPITIPIKKVDSLNVAAAGAILLYLLREVQ
jgi:TrmH family RNA methyltransferase